MKDTIMMYNQMIRIGRLVANNDVEVTVEVNHTGLVDMWDVSVFIENLVTETNGQKISVDVVLPFTLHRDETDYDITSVDIVKCDGLEEDEDDIAESLKSDWNGKCD